MFIKNLCVKGVHPVARVLAALAVASLVASGAACKSLPLLKIPHEGEIPLEKATSIKPGVTTKKEVEAAFGQPFDKLPANGGETYFYKDFNMRPLWIEFNAAGVVRRVKLRDE